MKRKPISEDVGWIVINMNAKGLSVGQISDYTMVSAHQVYRILGHHRASGGVVVRCDTESCGRLSKLLLADLEARVYTTSFLNCTDQELL